MLHCITPYNCIMKKYLPFLFLLILFSLFISCTTTNTPYTSEEEYAVYQKHREDIKTLDDLTAFLTKINYQEGPNDYDHPFFYKGREWSVNMTAYRVYLRNFGNCGGSATLFCDLLAGDYEEMGYIYRRDSRGGHGLNYFKDYAGKYHILDVSAFSKEYGYGNHIVRDTLQECADEYIRRMNYNYDRGVLDWYVRSLYAIKCLNGEPYPPVSTKPIMEGYFPGYFPLSLEPLVTELYVREDKKENKMLFASYDIPYKSYPKGLGYNEYIESEK